MALTDSTTFYGTDAEGFYRTALTTGVVKNELSLLPGVKSKIKMASNILGNILAADDCSFSAAGEGTLAQKTFEVCDLKINLSYCVTTFEQNYLSAQLRAGSNSDQVMPDSYASFVMASVAEKTASDIEKIILQGDTATASYPYSLCDGLNKKLLADGEVIDVTSSTYSITSAAVAGVSVAVQAELNRVLSAVPAQVRSKEDFKILVSQDIAFAYKQSLASTYYSGGTEGDKQLNYLGFKLVPTSALGAKQMIAFAASNVFFITDLASDFEAIRMIPQANITGARTELFAANLKVGINYMFGSEIVFYSAGTVMA